MLQSFKQNQIIKIIPTEINNACSATIIDTEKETITVKTNCPNTVLNGDCECFCATDSGVNYFKAKVKEIGNNTYELFSLSSYITMQRREYSRITLNTETTFKSGEENIKVLVTDFSAGGMKVTSKKELLINSNYSFSLEITPKLIINNTFTPIRQSKREDESYEISGKFTNITNKERISIIQYCFTRKMEDTNK